MATFVATLIIMGLVILGMSIGVLVHGRRLQGSCGGAGKACQCSPLAARRCAKREAREREQAEAEGLLPVEPAAQRSAER
ncbi:MAG: hypothetical protein QNK04_26405 [Myxococcota bacterium]|nr:hypothetical protein [Myxococcota bacterium]